MIHSAGQDSVVAKALARLPVADHQPGFWDRLDRSLEAVDVERNGGVPGTTCSTAVGGTGGGGEVGLVAVREWGVARPSRRRGARTPFLAAAAVVAVVALAGAVIASDGDRPGNIGVATSDGDPSAPNAPGAPRTSVPPVPPTQPGPVDGEPTTEPVSPDGAVLAWTDALGAGDWQQAAALLGPGSVDYIDSLGRQPLDFMAELSEGYGAWSKSADRSTTEVTVLASGEGSIEVVVLMGTVEQEGTSEYRTVALPVRSVDGRYRVEPLALGSNETRIEFMSPPPGPSGLGGLPADGVIEFLAPGADQVAVSLDDGEVYSPPVAPGGEVRFDPPGDMSSRTHLLVVASIGPEHITAVAVTFAVEG